MHHLLNDPRSKPVPTPWIAPITAWTLHLRAASHSPATIRTRSDHLRRAARALGPDPWAVDGRQLVDWAGRQAWRPETRRSVYASLRSFWRWAIAGGHTTADPTTLLPRVKAAQPHPRPAPDPVISRAKRGASDKVVLILRLAAELGLRRAEIAQVHSLDLIEDVDGWALTVHGKGGKDRDVPMGADLARAVIAACLAGGGYAFPGDDDGHWSAGYVGKLAARALPGEWTLHTLRHRFATAVHDASGDLLVVQQLLGHASVATTQRYVATRRDRLRRGVEAVAA